jgi:Asp-tRNA(Asn)/Glu-tRNA(Gln) amidotransferase A subunit family amidase
MKATFTRSHAMPDAANAGFEPETDLHDLLGLDRGPGRDESAGEHGGLSRRTFMAALSALGVGGGLFPGVLWARVQQQATITAAMVKDAEQVSGLDFTEDQRESIVRGLNRDLRSYEALRAMTIPNDVPFPMVFDPVVPGTQPPTGTSELRTSDVGRVRRPADLEQVAFWPVTKLAELVRTKQVRSEELTEMYLDRLKRLGPKLNCVVNLTDARALAQARRADADIKAGHYRGPLHGIPWGAKDLLAVKGYPTTWGAKPYEHQVIDQDAAVVKRLDDAGAVLLAKLTLGALANGDKWFGGQTKNPWNLEQGSSGSSAGPASATVAGLVGFGVGSETLGSIVSPSTRCGATGLRPSYGRVPRTGAMVLSWSMDKLGPLCRSVEDCALVLAAINGPDGYDRSVYDVPFRWDARAGLKGLRIGYFKDGFDNDSRNKELDEAALEVVRKQAGTLVPFAMPDDLPVNALRIILTAEGAAAFDDLTMSGRVDELVDSSWPRTFRQARFTPAVEYIEAGRVRALLMQKMHDAMRDVDVFVTPSFAGSVLLTTNLTGHPTVVLPDGFTDEGTPTSISFIGKLWNEAAALAVAKAYQDATDWHNRRPPEFAV